MMFIWLSIGVVSGFETLLWATEVGDSRTMTEGLTALLFTAILTVVCAFSFVAAFS